jgi:hypothetical protein
LALYTNTLAELDSTIEAKREYENVLFEHNMILSAILLKLNP